MKQTEHLSKLSTDLIKDVSDVRSGSLKVYKAKAISSLSCSAINAIAKGIMAERHHELQLKKLVVREEELQLERDKFTRLDEC